MPTATRVMEATCLQTHQPLPGRAVLPQVPVNRRQDTTQHKVVLHNTHHTYTPSYPHLSTHTHAPHTHIARDPQTRRGKDDKDHWALALLHDGQRGVTETSVQNEAILELLGET